jgi:integrase
MSLEYIPCILVSKGGTVDAHQKDNDLSGTGDARTTPVARLRGEGLDSRAYPARGDAIPEGSPIEQKARPEMRGDGNVYLRGNVYWFFYSFRGKTYRESAHTTDEKAARKLLKQRLKQVERPGFVGPKEDRWTIADMKARLEADYERKQNRSLDTVKHCFKHIEGAFEFRRVIDITTPVVHEYVKNRLAAGAARATVNRELAYLRHGFKLMLNAGDISAIPAVIELLHGENVRKGFIAPAEFATLAENIPDTDVRDLVEFLYNSGWRSDEGKKLEWSEVDLKNNMIRLPAEKSKSKKPRSLPVIGALAEVIQRRLEARRLDCPFVFHRGGKQIASFRKVFKAAALAASMPDLVPHDMRRSAVRNFRRAGLSEHEGMKLSGHETDSIYRRYDIISDEDLTESMNRVQEHLKKRSGEPEGCAAKTRKGLTWVKEYFHKTFTNEHFSRVGET